MPRLTVPKNHLVLVAGLVWCFAGAMVVLVGLPYAMRLAPRYPLLVPLAGLVFLAFSLLVFGRLVEAHTRRIGARPEARLPVWQCFSPSSWAVMAVMAGGGLTLRLGGVVPDWFVAFFYSGLGAALILAGLRFVRAFARGDALALQPEPVRSDD